MRFPPKNRDKALIDGRLSEQLAKAFAIPDSDSDSGVSESRIRGTCACGATPGRGASGLQGRKACKRTLGAR
jgi:hypothetical protein